MRICQNVTAEKSKSTKDAAPKPDNLRCGVRLRTGESKFELTGKEGGTYISLTKQRKTLRTTSKTSTSSTVENQGKSGGVQQHLDWVWIKHLVC